MDVAGEHQNNLDHEIHKTRVTMNGTFLTQERSELGEGAMSGLELARGTNGTVCGSCYGSVPAGKCCNTCVDVREFYEEKGWTFEPSEIEQVMPVLFPLYCALWIYCEL